MRSSPFVRTSTRSGWMADDSPKLVTPKGAKSPLWRYFGFEVNEQGMKVNESVVKCSRGVGYSKNTSNLQQHLEKHHPECLPGPSASAPSKQASIQSYSNRPKPKLKRGSKPGNYRCLGEVCGKRYVTRCSH